MQEENFPLDSDLPRFPKKRRLLEMPSLIFTQKTNKTLLKKYSETWKAQAPWIDFSVEMSDLGKQKLL
jgi:hypothetical protein